MNIDQPWGDLVNMQNLRHQRHTKNISCTASQNPGSLPSLPNQLLRGALLLALSTSLAACPTIAAAGVLVSNALGGGGQSKQQMVSSLTASTSSVPAETPAQKATMAREEAQMAAEQAAQDARIAKENQQSQESLNGMGGRYFLPPLPEPSTIRPMVGTQYQEQFPLSTKEIQWIKRQMQDDQYAIHKGAPLQIQNPSLPVSLGPGAKVPTIILSPGYVTTISIVGEDGSPWPVTSRQIGGGTSFTVSAVSQDMGAPRGQTVAKSRSGTPQGVAPKQGVAPLQGVGAAASTSSRLVPDRLPSNLLTISPLYFGSSSNMMLTLKGVSTPLMVNIVADGPHAKTVDGMVTLRVDQHGPDAPPPMYAPPPPSAVNPDLMLFLSQTPPKGAVRLRASGMFGVKAWAWNGRVIVRTHIPLLSPAWTAEVRQDGEMVYDLPKTRVLMLRDDMNAAGGTWQMRTVYLSSQPGASAIDMGASQ